MPPVHSFQYFFKHHVEARVDPGNTKRAKSQLSLNCFVSFVISSLKMVIKYKVKEILTLEDIQKLTVKDMRDVFKSNAENAGGMKADLVLKVYALLMWDVVLRSAENT